LGISGFSKMGLSINIGDLARLDLSGALLAIRRLPRAWAGTLSFVGAFNPGRGTGKSMSGTLHPGGVFRANRGVFPRGYVWLRGQHTYHVLRSPPPILIVFVPPGAPPLGVCPGEPAPIMGLCAAPPAPIMAPRP